MKIIFKLFPVFVWLILSSCSRAPEEVTDISTLRLVWNEDPTTNTTIVWDGMSKTDAIVYYGESDKGRNYKRYSFSETPYRSLSFYVIPKLHNTAIIVRFYRS